MLGAGAQAYEGPQDLNAKGSPPANWGTNWSRINELGETFTHGHVTTIRLRAKRRVYVIAISLGMVESRNGFFVLWAVSGNPV